MRETTKCWRVLRDVLTLSMVLCSVACDPPPTQHYRALVRVESDPGVPLAGARVALAGRELGSTDERGMLSLALSGPPGEQVALEVRCPEGFRASGAPISMVLRALKDASRLPEYRAACPPALRTLVVSVRAAHGKNLPVLYLGKEIARTDAHGAAHAVLKLRPEERVRLRLDTSDPEQQTLRPRNPEFTVMMPDHDDVVLFDQAFTIERPKKKKVRRPRPQLPVPLRAGV